MNIDAIITCVGREALTMLEFTYIYNLDLYDNLIIVTSPKDHDVELFCKRNKLQCIVTDVFNKNGAKFNKGAGINIALENLKYNDWVLHLDSDITSKPEDRLIMEKECIDKENFYGTRRIIVKNLKEFQGINKGEIDQTTLLSYPGIGFGYFQLWNQNSQIMKMGYKYPESFNTADYDWQFRNLWGDCINGDWEYTGKLKRLSFNVLHLGNPGVWNSNSFWEVE